MIEEILNLPLEFTVTVKPDTWKFKILRPREKLRRAAICAELLNLAPLESVSPEDYNRSFKLAHLNQAYLDGPEWFKDPEGKVKKMFEDFPDEDYSEHLFTKCMEKEAEYTEAKKKLQPDFGGEERKVDPNKSS